VREFSAGGLVVRRFRGRPWVAAVRVKNGLALPKGIIDAGETAAQAALREVREEAGLDARLVDKLGDVRYWYTRPGARVFKVVSFFLLAYRRGSVRDHDHEVLGAEWVPLAEAPGRLAYKGEREMAEKALVTLGEPPPPGPPRPPGPRGPRAAAPTPRRSGDRGSGSRRSPG
jgi:8-oxo-dGTP pyrophosphatase MutT (NUDIX family)